jgi:DNA-binding response OmpR family regulator
MAIQVVVGEPSVVSQMTVDSDERSEVAALDSGADDYLTNGRTTGEAISTVE